MEHCNEALQYIKKRDKNPIPGVMPILAGLGSPQEMSVHDEQWHTENFVWGNARDAAQGLLDARRSQRSGRTRWRRCAPVC